MTILKFLHDHWDKIILGILILIYIITLVTLSISRHDAFASRFDLSNMDQTLYYTLNGHFFQLRQPDEFVSRFSIHADLILVLLSPLYLIWDDVRMLIASESVFLGVGALPTFLIAKRLLRSKFVALIVSAVYLLNPGMQWTDIYDFHGVSLAIPFLLFAFYFALVKNWRWYWVFIVLALTTKENISLIVAMYGFFVLLYFKNRFHGFITIVIGLTWFITMVTIVMPYFTPSGNLWSLEGVNPSGEDSLTTIISSTLRPEIFANTFIWDKEAQDYYVLLLRPFGFLPIIGMPWLLLSAPEFAINILRKTMSIVFHYDSGIMPGLVISTIFALSYIKYLLNKIRWTKKYALFGLYMISCLLLMYAIRVNYQYSPLPTSPSCQCYLYNVTDEDRAFEKVLQQIPRNASVTASLEIRPHVSHREHAYTIPSATQSAKYIALITQNRLVSNYNPKEIENELIPRMLRDINYKLQFRSKHFYLFERVK